MNIIKGLMMIMALFGVLFAAQPQVSYAGTDVATEMAEEEADTGGDGELASLEPTAEDEQMIEDSQHGK